MALSSALVPVPSSLSRVYPSPSVILWFVLSVGTHKNTQTEIKHEPYLARISFHYTKTMDNFTHIKRKNKQVGN